MSITRSFKAPRELVFRLWTEPRHVARWWGPNGFTNTIEKMEVRPGGDWIFVMHGPDGRNYDNHFVFDVVEEPARLVLKHVSHPTFTMNVAFEADGEQTIVTLENVFDSEDEFRTAVEQFGAREGQVQHMDNMAKYTDEVSASVFSLTRELNAPRELVYDVWTKPEHLTKWWGPAGMKMKVAHLNLRPGGMFHYCMAAPDGKEMWGRFVYRDIQAPERMVFLNAFADSAGNPVRNPFMPAWPLEVMNVVLFEDHGNKTIVKMAGWPFNATAEEMALFRNAAPMMQQGFAGTFMQLESYLRDITG